MEKLTFEHNKILSRYKNLTSILIEKDGRIQITLAIIEDGEEIIITFCKVRSIEFPLKELKLYNPIWLNIIDVKNAQLDGSRFEVVDIEEEIIKFYCQSYEIAKNK